MCYEWISMRSKTIVNRMRLFWMWMNNLSRIFECIHICQTCSFLWMGYSKAKKDGWGEYGEFETKEMNSWMAFWFSHPIDNMKCISFYCRFVAIWINKNLERTNTDLYCCTEVQRWRFSSHRFLCLLRKSCSGKFPHTFAIQMCSKCWRLPVRSANNTKAAT